MWKELGDLKLKFNYGDWLIGGDFNAIKKRSERIVISLVVNKMEWREFSNFIDKCGLIDVPCKEKNIVGIVGMEKRRVGWIVFLLMGISFPRGE